MKSSPQQLDAAILVLGVIQRKYGVTLDEIESRRRTWRLVWPRFLAIHLVRRVTGWSKTRLAELFNHDREAINNALKKVRDYTDTNSHLRAELHELELLFPQP